MVISKLKCKKCDWSEFWELKDGRLKCRSCRYVFTLSCNPFRIKPCLLNRVIEEFLLEHSTDTILSRVDISKYKLLKISTLLRIVMTQDVPSVFSGVVEVDETYLGGRMKNKRLSERLKLGKNRRGFGTVKQPVFGILCRRGKVYAEVVTGIEARDLQPLIERRVKKGSTVCSDGWRAYTGLAIRGYVHRIVKHQDNQYSDRRGNHINGLEGFWGYLKRKLAAKGGIRRKRLPIYLGEYVWRYNNRHLKFKEQTLRLKKLLIKHFWSGN